MRNLRPSFSISRIIFVGLMRAVIICLTLFLASICAPATQANDALKHEEHPNRYDWSFAGVFGRYDTAQLRRGFKVYKEVCSTCHSIKMLAFRNLSQPGSTEFSEREIVELATSYKIKDGPNDSGEFLIDQDARAIAFQRHLQMNKRRGRRCLALIRLTCRCLLKRAAIREDFRGSCSMRYRSLLIRKAALTMSRLY